VNSFRSRLNGGKPAASRLLAEKPAQSRNSDAEGLEAVAVPRTETRQVNHRGDDRHRLSSEEAIATWNGAEHAVRLINLSGGGAMIAAPFSPLLWDQVDLALGGCGTLQCAVRWIKGGRLGLEFAHETQIETDPETLAQTLRAVIERSFPDIVGAVASKPAAPAPIDEAALAADQTALESHVTRQATRHPLIWNGLIHFNHDSSAVRLRNISACGALLEVTAALPVAAEVLLDLGDAGSLFATVHWVRGDQVGIRFHAPFDLTLLSRCKPELAPTHWSQPAYLRDESRDSSPWAREWCRLSLPELQSELEGFLKH
jgi:hypothetical protein